MHRILRAALALAAIMAVAAFAAVSSPGFAQDTTINPRVVTRPDATVPFAGEPARLLAVGAERHGDRVRRRPIGDVVHVGRVRGRRAARVRAQVAGRRRVGGGEVHHGRADPRVRHTSPTEHVDDGGAAPRAS